VNASLLALALWCGGAIASLALRWRSPAAIRVGVITAVAGGAAGALAAFRVLAGGPAEFIRIPWSIPFGSLSLALDPLAAAFLAPISIIGALVAVYGSAYLQPHDESRPVGIPFAAYNLLLAAMALVTLAENTVLFLIAWEGMTLASYALVVTDHEARVVRRAGVLYLVAAHVATAALLVLFLLLAGHGDYEIAALAAARGAAPAGTLFALALVGFGTKAGVAPLHIWLPDAHAAAPSHVSALMSGVMITLGFYGLARFLPLLGAATAMQAMVLIALGAGGAVVAIAHGLVQRDVKRVLAYSTVENAGLVTLAIGVARLAHWAALPELESLAWTAALLHLWNHAAFKSLMFMGVGAGARSIGSRDLEQWGGLLRAWPLAGTLILVGAAALASLPGMNGFVSEWLILRAVLGGALELHGPTRAVLVVALALAALALALALANAARLVGIGLLGRPRSSAAAGAPPPPRAMVVPMAILAALCVAGGCFATSFARAIQPAVATLVPGAPASELGSLLVPIGQLVGLLVAVTVVLAAVRWALGRGREIRRAPTWGCGYAAPTPRMQYTASSLSEPIVRLLAPVLRTRVRWSGIAGQWPQSASWASQALDRAITDLYRPAIERVETMAMRLRGMQEARVTTYLRYVVLALLVVLGLLFLPLRGRP
jgi:formate hydrogenlyase subunit 3/multisubunit Na+/H+ antiporter MnhD subunit